MNLANLLVARRKVTHLAEVDGEDASLVGVACQVHLLGVSCSWFLSKLEQDGGEVAFERCFVGEVAGVAVDSG